MWRLFARFVARAALSLLFSVSYLEPVEYGRTKESVAVVRGGERMCIYCQEEGKLMFLQSM
jgi:hypothetical protein